MKRNKIYTLHIILILILFSCIKPYEPELQSSDEKKLVVQAVLGSQQGYQNVILKYTHKLNTTEEIPASNYSVKYIDTLGNEFALTETTPGNYTIWMSAAQLKSGNSYKLNLISPDGEEIESSFETLGYAINIDTVYFESKTLQTNNPTKPRRGIQFYVDFPIGQNGQNFFKWEIVETWEKHAPRPIEWWYDGTLHHEVPPDYSRMLCYQTEDVPGIYILNTQSLSSGTYHGQALHFVSTQSQRLMHLYSFLLRQYTISPSTYEYWQRMQENISQRDGLYTKQPISVVGNMKNLSSPEKVVLGNFSAVGLTEKRIFVDDPGIAMDFIVCKSSPLRYGLWDVSPLDYPAYLDGNETTYFNTQLSPACVDCTRNGGTTTKPDFWP